MKELPKIVLKSGKDQSLMRFHPWVFSGAIKKVYGDVKEGDWVDVYNNKDQFLARGHYQNSSIAVRVLSFNSKESAEEIYQKRILNAYRLRKQLGLPDLENTNVFRLINAEGDGLPGLIVDYYAGTLVLQMHSAGMYHDLNVIINYLKNLPGLDVSSIYNKSKSTLPYKSGIDIDDDFLSGEAKSHLVSEYGCKFHIDIAEGQKTGFFIDQRENRRLLEKYSEGRNVLNMFGYTGGFSIYALRGGARLVHTVDASKKAAELSEENVRLNLFKESNHQSFARDAFDFFADPPHKYDLIILDPPAFAKHHNVLSNALQGYKKINRKAFEIIEPGGIVFTFSCSQVVSKENFRKSVFTAAANTGRNVQLLHQMSQPADHPVSIYHPEGEYLKGLVLKVD